MNTCINCGCDNAYPSQPPSPTPAPCPDPQQCAEVYDAQCIVYTLTDIVCGQDVVVTEDSNIADALSDIVSYFCQRILTLTNYITDIQADIQSIQSDIITIQGDITTLESAVSSLSDCCEVKQKFITYPANFTGTNYTLTNADNGYSIIVVNGATAVSIIVPTGLTAKFQAGFIQDGSADITFTPSSTTLNNAISGYKIKGQYDQAYLEQGATSSIYYLLGNTKV